VPGPANRGSTTQAGNIKKGCFLMLKGKPCRVTEVSTSKTGKHGHAKNAVVGLDIFTGKKYDGLFPCSHSCEVPVIDKDAMYILIDIEEEDKFMTLMAENGDTREDMRLPDNELGEQIAEGFEAGKELSINTWKAMGHEQVMNFKEQVTNCRRETAAAAAAAAAAATRRALPPRKV